MSHEPIELDSRLSRCERAIFGDDNAAEGLSARMHMTESTLAKIDATLAKLNWLIVAGVVVGVLNLLISRQSPTMSGSAVTDPKPQIVKESAVAVGDRPKAGLTTN